MTAARGTRAAPSLGDRLAAAFGEAARELGVRPDPSATIEEMHALIRAPVALYERHPHWPSRFTTGGMPLELSLKLDDAGSAALRCVVDVTDHRGDLTANLPGYLDACALVGGRSEVGDEALAALCELHLADVPSSLQSRMVHGLGYGPDDWSRGSLYFRTGWLDRAALARRAPDAVAALDEAAASHGSPAGEPVEVLGYDLVVGSATPRCKAYSWVAIGPDASFEEVAGRHPDLTPARAVFDAFRDAAEPQRRPRALMLQTSIDRGERHQRLFFFSAAWGWEDEAGLGALWKVLRDDLGIDTDPLRVVLDAAARHAIELMVPLVAVGAEGASDASATVYLWPRPVRDAAGADAAPASFTFPSRVRPPDVGPALDRAVAWLLDALRPDGRWGDDDATAHGVTARVGAMLHTAAAPRDELAAPLAWLAERMHGENGHATAVDAQTAALSLGALAGGGRPVPDEIPGVLLADRGEDGLVPATAGGDGSPGATATVLLGYLQGYPRQVGAIVPLVFAVAQAQREDGGWHAAAGEAPATTCWQATHALRAYRAHPLAKMFLGRQSAGAAQMAARRAVGHLLSMPVAPEPCDLAAWLGAWINATGDLRHPSVVRIADALAELQQPGGGWDGPAGSTSAPADARLVATATVVGALQTLRRAAARP